MRTLLSIVCLITLPMLTSLGANREFYEIRTYQVGTTEQEKIIEEYLERAYLPALYRAGIKTIGVFKPVESDTALFGKRIFVLIPFTDWNQYIALPDVLLKDQTYQSAGKKYLDAPYTSPSYQRFESVIVHAFKDMPKLLKPDHAAPKQNRVYELRSYEGASEKIYKSKEKMFNEGGEIALFKRLGFNAVFYGEVVAGSRRPNLMYMITFSDMASRDAHWKTFSADPEWKKMSSIPEYQNTVSGKEIFLLHPTSYSDL